MTRDTNLPSRLQVRLVLVLAPAACLLGAIGLSEFLQTYMTTLRQSEANSRLSIQGAKKVLRE
eukprot:SAG11_NODE_3354_length_2506_cov_0.999585_3_plen_63_part_00